MPIQHSLLNAIFAIGFVAAGCWAILLGLRRLPIRNPELSWLKVPGRVTLSGVDVQDDSDGGKTYRAQLEYVYEHHGLRFIGQRVAPLQFWSGFRSKAESVTRRYPPGRAVTVYVNPRDPGRAVLEPGRQVMAACCYALIGIAFCVMAFVVTSPR